MSTQAWAILELEHGAEDIQRFSVIGVYHSKSRAEEVLDMLESQPEPTGLDCMAPRTTYEVEECMIYE